MAAACELWNSGTSEYQNQAVDLAHLVGEHPLALGLAAQFQESHLSSTGKDDWIATAVSMEVVEVPFEQELSPILSMCERAIKAGSVCSLHRFACSASSRMIVLVTERCIIFGSRSSEPRL